MDKTSEGTKKPDWVGQLGLDQSHKESIKNGNWLTDEIIAAGLVLLSMAYPKMQGLQTPLLGLRNLEFQYI